MTGPTAAPVPEQHEAPRLLAGTDLLVVTALRIEHAVLAGRVPGARLERCGMGPARVDRWLHRRTAGPLGALVVAGVGGGLDPAVRPGDVVVASAVTGPAGSVALPAAAPLVAELRRLGVRVHHGPVRSVDHVVRGSERGRLAATGAVAVDMESAMIVGALAGLPGRVPTAVVRVVVDAADAPLAGIATLTAGAVALRTLHRLAPILRWWADQSRPTTLTDLTGPHVGAEDSTSILSRKVVA